SAGIDEIESKKLITDGSSISNLKNNATEIITSLRDTIWAFNKESITLTGISDRIKAYTQKIQPAYPQIRISLEENINKEKQLSPVQALHIFRIVQEALQNALRHSNCSEVLINIASHDGLTSIAVEDNGKGFDPEKVQNAGNGLINMKTRSVESGYTISFEKNTPTGAKVSIVGK
ncbi:MAG TPA: ATP-binding protein, partial [Puia sp.]|nr:ATP-binding protein [Puia sp.]